MTARPPRIAAAPRSNSPADGGTRIRRPIRARPARLFALKQGDTFVVADAFGDITGEGDGLFHDDTRLLSRFRLSVGGRPLELLGGAVGEDNVVFTANLTNRPLPPIGGQSTRQGVIHVERTRLIWEDRLYERLRLRNFGQRAGTAAAAAGVRRRLSRHVRGARPHARGARAHPRGCGRRGFGRAELRGPGRPAARLDARLRPATRPTSRPASPTSRWRSRPKLRTDIFYEVGLDAAETALAAALPHGGGAKPGWRPARCAVAARRVQTSGRVFSEWLDRSRADLALLTTEFADRPLSLCGHPVVLDRLRPRRDHHRAADAVARSVAGAGRAALSGGASGAPRPRASPTRRPARSCTRPARARWSACGELPFGSYYGGVDTTPLFVVLAGAYAARTGDLALVDELWPALLAAMALDRGRRRFRRRRVRRLCARRRDRPRQPGLEGQRGLGVRRRRAATSRARWRWSRCRATRSRRSGPWPTSPRGAARPGEACAAWQAKAERLRLAVEERFWVEELGTYALALDGRGRPCRVRASNAGHLLFAGLPAPERGRAGGGSSCWAARSTPAGACARSARDEPRYNPMSYHNGSVWPHDTALCAAGIARYGARDGAAGAARATCSRPRSSSTCGCRSCSAASRGGRASRRSPIRWPACRRPGPRARCS